MSTYDLPPTKFNKVIAFAMATNNSRVFDYNIELKEITNCDCHQGVNVESKLLVRFLEFGKIHNKTTRKEIERN